MTVALSDILSSRKLSGDTVTFNATEDWMQGRTMFGGFLTAMAVVAMRDTLAIDIPLRALQVNFIGPVAKGDVVYRTRLLRQGKNVTQVQCEIWSEEVMAGLVVGIFGLARQTQLNVRMPVRKPLNAHPDDLPPVPFVPQLTPNFLQHIDMRWALGNMPYSGQICHEAGIHIRTIDKNLSPEVLIVMLSDGPPTPVLSQFNGPVMASSVSWSLDLPYCPLQFAEDGWFQVDLDAVAVSDGYVNQSAKLWTPDGYLASLGHQVVAVFG
jgi:acyl-CoA thioesterase